MKKNEERKNFLLDSDGDGLPDELEKRIGTDPHKADTDGDGISDFEEICRNSNPRGEGSLSNLFIPSKDNNYQPRILRPKRVFFWLGSSLIIEAIIIIFVLLFPLIVWLTPDLMREESAKIIDLTNQLRVRQGVSNLKTSELLAQAAYQKAEDMLYQQYFSHVGPNQKKAGDWASQNGYQYLVIGENLAMGFAGSEEVVNAWVKSPTHYANLIDPLYQEIGVGMVSGPFQDQDTTLVAQFFARPTKFQSELPSEEVIIEELEETIELLEEPLTVEAGPELEAESILALEPDLEIVEEIISERTREEVLSFEENNRELEKEEDVSEELEEVVVISEEFQPDSESVLGERASLGDNQILDKEELNEEDFLSLPEEKVLGEPILVFPSDNFLNNQKDVNLKIFAPHAEKVTVFINDKAEGLAFPDEELKDYFIFRAQNLPEEEISFYFKAEKGEEKKNSQNYSLINDFSPPEIDLESSRVWVDEPAEGKEKIIQVEVYFNEEAKKAIATVEGININLAPGEESPLVWLGQIISFKAENSLAPITLPSVFVEDEAGNQARYNLEWENLEPAKTSLLGQYYLKKKYPSGPLKLILNIGSWFYRLLLIIFAIALILNIFIQIKHQNIKTILVSLLAIILLVALLLI